MENLIGMFSMFCDSIALIYHESRNVRHLIRRGKLKSEPWRFVVSLPTNRDEAWCEIAPLRDKALQTQSVDGALKLFESRFHVSLLDLTKVFANKNWRHAKLYGGNAWAAISKLTSELADALRIKDASLAIKLTTQLQDAQHNTGSLIEKLARLERAGDHTSA